MWHYSGGPEKRIIKNEVVFGVWRLEVDNQNIQKRLLLYLDIINNVLDETFYKSNHRIGFQREKCYTLKQQKDSYKRERWLWPERVV